MEDRLAQLEARIAQLMDWKQAREIQAIPFPLDDASRNTLGIITVGGTSAAGLTQTISVGSTPSNITVPAAYTGKLTLSYEGGSVTVPIL